jgi:hypothetical protein
MTNSVHQDRQGPVWPLGNIIVPTPGVPVSIMSLVDAAFVNAPETPTPGTSGANEYASRAMTIDFYPFKATGSASPKLTANSGVVYIVRKPTGAPGTGVINDVGVIVAALRSTDAPFRIPFNALDRNTYNLYEFYIDADTANDGCQVTAYIAG